MKTKKIKVIVFVLIAVFCTVLGVRVAEKEKQYKSFFVERNNAGAVIAPTMETQDEEKEEEIMVNINTDKAYELMLLEGIGEKTAEKIIEYRKENGDFEVIEDLMKVNGIGKKKFEKMKDHICVE